MGQTKAGAKKAQEVIKKKYGVNLEGKSILHVRAGNSVKIRGKGGGFRDATLAIEAGRKGGKKSRTPGNVALMDRWREIRDHAMTHGVQDTMEEFNIPQYAVYATRKYRTYQGYRYEQNKSYEQRTRKYGFIKNAEARKPFSDGIRPDANILSDEYALNSIDEMNGKHKPIWASLLGWTKW